MFLVVKENSYATEAYSFNFSDTAGEHPDLLVGTIPEATSRITSDHILATVFEVEKQVEKHNLPLVGHCTDSVANALNALIKLASPSTYTATFPVHSFPFIGLPTKTFRFYVSFLRPGYPSIAYPCWDHSGRTVIRNLTNDKIDIVCGEYPDKVDALK